MKRQIILSVLALFLCANFSLLRAGTFDPKKYKEIESSIIKAQPEEYRNKTITFETKYRGYRKAYPNYIIKSGFKSHKYYWFVINPEIIPAMAKKTEMFNNLIQTLKPGTTIKVYGKLRKLKYSPKRRQQDFFYLELKNIEIIASPTKKKQDKTNWKNLSPQERKRLRKLKNKAKNNDDLGGTVTPP